jgi:hypothetical protein
MSVEGLKSLGLTGSISPAYLCIPQVRKEMDASRQPEKAELAVEQLLGQGDIDLGQPAH